MSEDAIQQEQMGPKSHWSMGMAVGTMVAGGVLILVPWFLTVEEGSALHYVKVGIGMIGFITLCVGAYKRP